MRYRVGEGEVRGVQGMASQAICKKTRHSLRESALQRGKADEVAIFNQTRLPQTTLAAASDSDKVAMVSLIAGIGVSLFVELVANDMPTDAREVDANLMRASGLQLAGQQARDITECFYGAVVRNRFPCLALFFRIAADSPFVALAWMPCERRRDASGFRLWDSPY